MADREECGFCKRKKKIDPDLSGFSQPAGLRVRSIPPVLFQVFGPIGRIRRRSGGLDHRISVVVVVVIGGRGIVTSGSRYGSITASGVGMSTGTTAAVGAGGDGGSSAFAVVGGGGGGGGSGNGGGGAFEAFGVCDTSTVIVVDVGYDYGVG